MKVESIVIKFRDKCEACGWISVSREYCANDALKGNKPWPREIPDITTTPKWCPLDDLPIMSGTDAIKILRAHIKGNREWLIK